MRHWSHLTRIVGYPLGVNILGLLEFFAWIGSFMVMTNDSLSLLLARPLILLIMVAIAAFDLWWRNGQPEAETRGTWFSPYTGGCFMFLPVWLWMAVQFAALAIGLIVISIKSL